LHGYRGLDVYLGCGKKKNVQNFSEETSWKAAAKKMKKEM
jgi:hypothetical protein